MKIRRKVLPVTIIVLTDEGLCRMANWSPISFADIPTSNEYRLLLRVKARDVIDYSSFKSLL